MKIAKRIAGILSLLSTGLFAYQLVLLIVNSISLREIRTADAIGVIGSADGPTSIFVAFRAQPDIRVTFVCAAVCFALWTLFRQKEKDKDNK